MYLLSDFIVCLAAVLFAGCSSVESSALIKLLDKIIQYDMKQALVTK